MSPVMTFLLLLECSPTFDEKNSNINNCSNYLIGYTFHLQIYLLTAQILLSLYLEGFLSCGPLIETEIDPSVMPNSALFSW